MGWGMQSGQEEGPQTDMGSTEGLWSQCLQCREGGATRHSLSWCMTEPQHRPLTLLGTWQESSTGQGVG